MFAAQADIYGAGIILAFCTAHSVVDAVSIGVMIHRWSEYCAQVSTPESSASLESHPPIVHDRSLLQESGRQHDEQGDLAIRMKDALTNENSIFNKPSEYDFKCMVTRVFSVDIEALTKLKKEMVHLITIDIDSRA